MACNLLKAGFALSVLNRTPAKAQSLVKEGALLAASAVEVGKAARVVILMLPDGKAVTEVLLRDGLLKACQPGTLIIDMSSIAPAVAVDHAALAREAGLRYLDAPVSGGTIGAETGSLTIMVGGHNEDLVEVEQILRAMGTPHLLGPAGRGQLCKLANLTIVAVTIGAVGEALTLVRAAGGHLVRVREVLLGGFSQSRILELHGQRMIDRVFEPGGRIKSQLKDLRTILETAADYGVAMPLTTAVHDLFLALRQSLGDDLDHSALILQIEALRS
jgi:2-hydroxy-3-oxopropionate reductase